MAETDLVRAMLAALAIHGYWAWRTNSGVTVLGNGAARRVIRGAPAGTPDILAVVSGGRLCGLEAKTARGRQNAAQREWGARARAFGVGYVLFRSVGDGLAGLRAYEGRA